VKKTALGLSLIFSLLFSAAFALVLVNSAAGIVPRSTMPAVVINSDGSITGREWNPQYREFEIPYTEFINRTGNVYTLTADIEGYAVIIERSNIIFDGAEHTIHTPPPEAGTVHSNAGLNLHEATNVTVKNLEVSGVTLSRGIDLYYSYNCIFTGIKTFNIHYSDLTETVSQVRILGDFNTITESDICLNVDGSNNLFIKNNVHELDVYGFNNRCYQNNFFLTDIPDILSDNFWDNGAVGNYWSNYSRKYPNASEIGNSGIGDTPYIIERRILPSLNDPDAENVDYYPLMCPYDIENDTIAFPTPEPQPSPSPEPQPEQEPFPTALVAAASGVAVAIIGVGLLVYFKKRKH
jgi:hypothetical protein